MFSKYKLIVSAVLFLALLTRCASIDESLDHASVDSGNPDSNFLEPGVDTEAETKEPYLEEMKIDLASLLLAYPDDVAGIETESSGVWLLMASGDRILYDDGLVKSFEEKLENADVQDMLEMPYPLEATRVMAEEGCDPGRIRCYPFFNALYGSTQEALEEGQTRVAYGSQSLRFNSAAGVSAAFTKAAGEIEKYLLDNPEASGYAFPSSGAFYYRTILETDRLSPHAYGIAVDLVDNPDDYWEKSTYERGSKRLAGYPTGLVEIFEDKGFIWGGKWHHFDLMHYEYRPELIIKAKMMQRDGSVDTNEMKDAVDMIDSWLK